MRLLRRKVEATRTLVTKRFFIIVLLCVVLTLVLRSRGIPEELCNLPVVGCILDRSFGRRIVTRYSTGKIAATEIFKGGNVYAVDDDTMKSLRLVRGDYYDASGHRRSTVRRGTGIVLGFHDNNVLHHLVVFLDGRTKGPIVLWHRNGIVNSVYYPDESGAHDVEVTYHSDGSMASRRYYSDDSWTGVHMEWYSDGALKSRQEFEHGQLVSAAYYDTSGVITQKVVVGREESADMSQDRSQDAEPSNLE